VVHCSVQDREPAISYTIALASAGESQTVCSGHASEPELTSSRAAWVPGAGCQFGRPWSLIWSMDGSTHSRLAARICQANCNLRPVYGSPRERRSPPGVARHRATAVLPLPNALRSACARPRIEESPSRIGRPMCTSWWYRWRKRRLREISRPRSPPRPEGRSLEVPGERICERRADALSTPSWEAFALNDPSGLIATFRFQGGHSSCRRAYR